MLRITVHHTPESLTFQLEGKLAGPWVRELADCWQRTRAGRSPAEIRIDLTAVTFVDAAGKELLAKLHGQRARLLATGCLMKSLVEEISRRPDSSAPK
jgi:anti-anti-sigma regulatory factor